MSENHNLYDGSEVTGRVVEDLPVGKIYLIFQTPLETQFYSPGVGAKYSSDSAVVVRIARARITERQPAVDIRADYLPRWIAAHKLDASVREKVEIGSAPNDQIVDFPATISKISFAGIHGENEVWTREPR